MKINLVLAALMLLWAGTARALEFEGASAQAIAVDVPATTGLQKVFVVPSVQGLGMVYTARSSQSDVRWYRFSNLGGAYAEEIVTTRNGARVKAPAQPSDMGYIIEEGTDRYCYWLVDYSAHELRLDALEPALESECGRSVLSFTGSAADIPYYTINGRRMVLSRELSLNYNTLAFDEESFAYTSAMAHETLEAASATISVPAALCDTRFTLEGDRFLKTWGRELSVESPSVNATSVEAHTRATQTDDKADNEQTEAGAEGLGGSAPCEISFEAVVTDAAIFTEWQISRSPDFSIIENSFNEVAFTYTFTEQGTTYVRFVANNADGTCEYAGDTYQVFIGESKLEIPNAFSPDASPGVNDEWKVSYKSLISYQCNIFNRWGVELFSSSDPSQGWDGKYKGKYVPAGVYFYVIKARGADGINYEKAGDINIIKYKGGNFSPDSPEATE